jgi:hypothetical protein
LLPFFTDLARRRWLCFVRAVTIVAGAAGWRAVRGEMT